MTSKLTNFYFFEKLVDIQVVLEGEGMEIGGK